MCLGLMLARVCDATTRGYRACEAASRKSTHQRWPARRGAIMVQEEKQRVYTCPMHPDVRQTEPGTCPKCGMELEAREE